MKERFWFVYYWSMVSYLVLALVTIVEYKNTYELVEARSAMTGETCEEYSKRIDREWEQGLKDGLFSYELPPKIWNCEPGVKVKNYLPVSGISEFSNRNLFFNFMGNPRKVGNYYPFVLVFLMTLIRFIFIGKHIWQRPETD